MDMKISVRFQPRIHANEHEFGKRFASATAFRSSRVPSPFDKLRVGISEQSCSLPRFAALRTVG